MADTRSAVCPCCEREIRLKRDGAFRQHQAWVGGRTLFPPPCEGAGLTPEAAAELADA